MPQVRPRLPLLLLAACCTKTRLVRTVPEVNPSNARPPCSSGRGDGLLPELVRAAGRDDLVEGGVWYLRRWPWIALLAVLATPAVSGQLCPGTGNVFCWQPPALLPSLRPCWLCSTGSTTVTSGQPPRPHTRTLTQACSSMLSQVHTHTRIRTAHTTPHTISSPAVRSLDKLSGVSMLGDIAVGVMAASGVALAGGVPATLPWWP